MRHWHLERVRDHRGGVAIRFCSVTQGACSAGAPGPDAMLATTPRRPPRASPRSRRVAAHLELKSCKRSVEALPCNERMREVTQGFTRMENSFPTDLLKTSTDEGTSSIVPHPLRRLSPPLLASIALSLYVVYVVTELEPLGQTDIDGTDGSTYYMYLLFMHTCQTPSLNSCLT